MALNRPLLNTDYDSINENSSNDQKLDVLFKVMSGEDFFNYVQYEKLFVRYDQQPLFNAIIEETGFVESRQPNGSQIMYKLTNKGRLILAKNQNSYLKYLDSTTES